MKFNTTGEKIKSKISLLEKITSKNNQLRALQTILFVVKNNKLVVRATNLDVGVEITIPVKVEKEGTFALLGSVLNNFLNTLKTNDSISFELIDTNILISSKNSTTLIKSEPTEDFPTIPNIVENKQNISSKTLIDGFKSVFFSVSTSDIKPEISSVYIYNNEKDLYFVATDSFRLAEKKIENIGVVVDSIMIPYKNSIEIIRFFETINDTVDLCFDKNQLSVKSNDTYLTTRLVNGIYPNYRQIIPTSFKTQVVLIKDDFLEALKKSSVFLDEFNRLTIKTYKDDDIIDIDSKNSNIGENTTRVQASVSGDDVSMGFNHRYISEVLQHISTDSITLKFVDQNRPLIITPVGDTTFLYLVMPVNR